MANFYKERKLVTEQEEDEVVLSPDEEEEEAAEPLPPPPTTPELNSSLSSLDSLAQKVGAGCLNSSLGDLMLSLLAPKKTEDIVTLVKHWVHLFPPPLMAPSAILVLSGNALKFLLDPALNLPNRRDAAAALRNLSLSPGGGDEDENSSNTSWGSAPMSVSPPPGLAMFLASPSGDGEGFGKDDSEEEEPEKEEDNGLINLAEMLEEVDVLMTKIDKAVAELGGAVLPKVNWKAPKDARWLALNKSLKCLSADDVLLLLKHSINVEASVVALPDGYRHTLVLFKWEESLTPDKEFRCVVMNNKLVFIGQRDTNQGYSSIVEQRDEIIRDIQAFYAHQVYGRFPLENYVMDVARDYSRVIILDFSTLGPSTVPGLSTYKELKAMEAGMSANYKEATPGLVNPNKFGDPHFRYVTEAVMATPNPDIQTPIDLQLVTCLMGGQPEVGGLLASILEQEEEEGEAGPLDPWVFEEGQMLIVDSP